MEVVGLSERVETNQNSLEKRTVGERTRQNTKLEDLDGRSRELQSFVGERRARW